MPPVDEDLRADIARAMEPNPMWPREHKPAIQAKDWLPEGRDRFPPPLLAPAAELVARDLLTRCLDISDHRAFDVRDNVHVHKVFSGPGRITGTTALAMAADILRHCRKQD